MKLTESAEGRLDEMQYGARDERGHWKPAKELSYPPIFVWPLRPVALGKWLLRGGNWFPFNLAYGTVALAIWFFLTPSMSTMATFSPGWIGYLLALNEAIALAAYGAIHLRLYIRRRQGTAFKYNPKWPASRNSAFLFGGQTVDNVIRTLGSGVPIMTAYEVVTFWAFANHVIPYVRFADHPIYCVALYLLIPVWREVHFYGIHRLIHIPVFYRAVHRIHHNNVNPGPWSGLAMHPVEQVLYFSSVLIHWIVPSYPAVALFNLIHLELAPINGHTGFDKVVVGGVRGIDTQGYDHYLHHKHFECNYSDGVIPLDKWFGTWHDGSEEAEGRMNQRLMERARVQAEKKVSRAARKAR